MRRLMSALALLSLAACTPMRPPAPPVQRAPTDVHASFGATWDAVIDLFAERSIPIRNMERASGFIVTEQLVISDVVMADSVADCGTDIMGTPKFATRGSYNVLVRGDSSASTVKVTARWIRTESHSTDVTECSTRGVWETAFENDVKRRAEAHFGAK